MRKGSANEVQRVLVVPIALGLMWLSGSWTTDTLVYAAVSASVFKVWLRRLSRLSTR